MKNLAVLLIAISGLASACIVVDVPVRGRDVHHDDRKDGPRRADRDADGDGVPNRKDKRPIDPQRY